MALATSCPNCHAMFRVVADQLKLRGGLVRCGACRNVFDAISMLNYIDDATIVPSPAATQPEVEDVGGAAPVTTEALSGDVDVDAHERSADDEVPRDRAATDAATPEGEADEAARRAGEGDAPDDDAARGHPAGAEHVAAVGGLDVSSLSGSAAEAAPGTEDADAGAPAPADAAAPYEWNAATVHTMMATEGADQAATSASPEPAFLQSKQRARGFSIVFGGGATLLALLLLLQLMVVFRSEILVRVPQALPVLTQACALFNCSVSWPARSELLAIVGSELQAIPGTNVLELTTTVRNRALHRQPLPAIELTLTDAANRTVARKVFAPADYLAGSSDAAARLAAGIDAGAETTIRLAFEAQGQNVTGYGFLVYPFHL